MEILTGNRHENKPVEADENSAWKNFEASGKVTDYLSYTQLAHGYTTPIPPDGKPAK